VHTKWIYYIVIKAPAYMLSIHALCESLL